MQNQLMLLEDVDNLGRSGDIVTVKPGYARNFLVPQAKAVFADKRALNMRAKLIEERAKLAVVERAEAEALVETIGKIDFSIEVKVDPEGKLYGSVTAADILKFFEKENIILEKKNIVLVHPIKQVGVYKIDLKLKEGVTTSINLKISGDQPDFQFAREKAPEQTEL